MTITVTKITGSWLYMLITLVVPDEFGKFYPVGHLISNKEDKNSLSCFSMLLNKSAVKVFPLVSMPT